VKVTIEKNQSRSRFGELACGQCFEFAGSAHMKVGGVLAAKYNSVRLSNGLARWLCSTTPVRKLETAGVMFREVGP
jgi:hypothetical protein